MGADRLDVLLEPLAEILLLLLLLVAVAALTSILLTKLAARRRERRHAQISASKRLEETGIDLFGRDRSESNDEGPKPKTRKASGGGADNLRIDLSQKPGDTGQPHRENPVHLWLKSRDEPDPPQG